MAESIGNSNLAPSVICTSQPSSNACKDDSDSDSSGNEATYHGTYRHISIEQLILIPNYAFIVYLYSCIVFFSKFL